MEDKKVRKTPSLHALKFGIYKGAMMRRTRMMYSHVAATVLTLVASTLMARPATGADRPEEGEIGVSNSPLTGDEFGRGARAVLTTTDLRPGGRDGASTTLTGVINALFDGAAPGKVTPGVAIGQQEAVGTFGNGNTQAPLPTDGFAGPVGINSGAIVSTGDIFDARGGPAGAANTIDNMSTNWGRAGDPALDGLKLPGATRDAAGFTFTVTIAPNTPQLFTCTYVFASDEYNEWVSTSYNDIFGVFVDGLDVARVPAWCGGPAGVPVSINNINGGNPFPGAAPPNGTCYRDWPGGTTNDCGLPPAFPCAPPLLEFEPDGSTRVLRFATLLAADPGNPVVHNVKVVIADNRDRIYDSDAFIRCSLEGGACSVPDGPGCICQDVLNADECTALGGTFELGVSCEDQAVPCEPTGACCQAFGTCVETTPSACAAGDGTYQGDGTACGPIGACSTGSECIETTQTCCTGAGGAYGGDGTLCIAQGACCTVDGSCTLEEPGNCMESYAGDGTTCLGDNNNNGFDDACEARGIPTVTEWGIIIMTVLVMTAGTIVFSRWRRRVPA